MDRLLDRVYLDRVYPHPMPLPFNPTSWKRYCCSFAWLTVNWIHTLLHSCETLIVPWPIHCSMQDRMHAVDCIAWSAAQHCTPCMHGEGCIQPLQACRHHRQLPTDFILLSLNMASSTQRVDCARLTSLARGRHISRCIIILLLYTAAGIDVCWSLDSTSITSNLFLILMQCNQ